MRERVAPWAHSSTRAHSKGILYPLLSNKRRHAGCFGRRIGTVSAGGQGKIVVGSGLNHTPRCSSSLAHTKPSPHGWASVPTNLWARSISLPASPIHLAATGTPQHTPHTEHQRAPWRPVRLCRPLPLACSSVC